VAIDWSKPYGEIQGLHKAKYEQDGIQYDLHGKELNSEKRNKAWAKKQTGLGGRNLLIWEAKNIGGIIVDPHEKIESIRKKVMDRLPA
jgi:hypothetical protein